MNNEPIFKSVDEIEAMLAGDQKPAAGIADFKRPAAPPQVFTSVEINHSPARAEGESFEQYKARRKALANLAKVKAKGVLVHQSQMSKTTGSKSFSDVDAEIIKKSIIGMTIKDGKTWVSPLEKRRAHDEIKKAQQAVMIACQIDQRRQDMLEHAKAIVELAESEAKEQKDENV